MVHFEIFKRLKVEAKHYYHVEGWITKYVSFDIFTNLGLVAVLSGSSSLELFC